MRILRQGEGKYLGQVGNDSISIHKGMSGSNVCTLSTMSSTATMLYS